MFSVKARIVSWKPEYAQMKQIKLVKIKNKAIKTKLCNKIIWLKESDLDNSKGPKVCYLPNTDKLTSLDYLKINSVSSICHDAEIWSLD